MKLTNNQLGVIFNLHLKIIVILIVLKDKIYELYMFEKKCQSCYYFIYIYIYNMFCTCLRKSVVIIIYKKN